MNKNGGDKVHNQIVIQLTWPTISILLIIGLVIAGVRRRFVRRREIENFVRLVEEASENQMPVSSLIALRYIDNLKLTPESLSFLGSDRVQELIDALAVIRNCYPELHDIDVVPVPK